MSLHHVDPEAAWTDPEIWTIVGEELNSSEVTRPWAARGTAVAVVDRATGKVGGAENPRNWGNFFDFRAIYMLRLRNSEDFPGSDHAP